MQYISLIQNHGEFNLAFQTQQTTELISTTMTQSNRNHWCYSTPDIDQRIQLQPYYGILSLRYNINTSNYGVAPAIHGINPNPVKLICYHLPTIKQTPCQTAPCSISSMATQKTTHPMLSGVLYPTKKWEKNFLEKIQVQWKLAPIMADIRYVAKYISLI